MRVLKIFGLQFRIGANYSIFATLWSSRAGATPLFTLRRPWQIFSANVPMCALEERGNRFFLRQQMGISDLPMIFHFPPQFPSADFYFQPDSWPWSTHFLWCFSAFCEQLFSSETINYLVASLVLLLLHNSVAPMPVRSRLQRRSEFTRIHLISEQLALTHGAV